mmetsp:Transcript_341/g.409  ORF Transcript_341/g.409 Transcript_341/m.409 type:complete len:84 (-) Transcript_341:644-895(-)
MDLFPNPIFFQALSKALSSTTRGSAYGGPTDLLATTPLGLHSVSIPLVENPHQRYALVGGFPFRIKRHYSGRPFFVFAIQGKL